MRERIFHRRPQLPPLRRSRLRLPPLPLLRLRPRTPPRLHLQGRHLCPACHQRRVRQTADWIADHLLRHPFSLQKITWNPTTQTVIYRSKRHHTTKRNFEIFIAPDFIAAIGELIEAKKGSEEGLHMPEISRTSDRMFYACILRSEQNPERFYYGYSSDLKARLTPTNRPLLRPLVQQNPRPTIPHPRPHHPPAGALFKSTIGNQQSSIGNRPRPRPTQTNRKIDASPLTRPHPQSLGSRPTRMPVLQSSHETRRCRQTPGANRIFSASPRFVGRHHPAPSPATASFRHRDDGT